MERRRHTYDNGKVGENVLLPVSFFDSDGAALSVSSARIWIKRVGKAVVANEWATLTSDSGAEFDWVPTIPAAYVVEWVAYDSDGRITKSVTCDIEIEAAVGTDTPATPATPPTTLPHWVLPGTYSVPEGAAGGKLVAITGVGVANTYATRAEGGNAADAVVYQLLSPTTARLARICTLSAFSGLTPGAALYLGVDGAVSHTPSTTDGEIDQLVGEAESETRASLWTVDRPSVVGEAGSGNADEVAQDLADHIADAGDPHAAAGYQTASEVQTAIDAAITALIGGAPGALDTLNELAAALNDDASFAATVASSLAGKLSLSGGTLTGALGAGTQGTFTETGGVISVDVSAKNDHRQTDTIGADAVCTLTGGAEGRQGTLVFRQDGTGHALSFVATGWTTVVIGAVPTTANASFSIGYMFVGPSGSGELWIFAGLSVSAFIQTLLDDADAATALATLGALAKAGDRMTGRLGAKAPTSFTVSAGAVSIDVSANNDHAQSGSMSQTTAITLTGFADGDQGTVVIEQDSTGRTVTFVASGRTVEYAGGSIPSTSAASKRIFCTYWFNTKPGGAAYLSIVPVVMG